MSVKADSTEAEEIIARQGRRIAKLETALRLAIDRLEAVGTGRINYGEAIAAADELKRLHGVSSNVENTKRSVLICSQ